MKLLISTSAIPLSAYRKWGMHGKWDRTFYDDLFKRFSGGDKTRYRLYLPLIGTIARQHKCVAPAKIVEKVETAGYYIEDYIAGIAISKKDGKRKIRIGKLLNDDANLKNTFDSDPQRQAAKLATATQMVVISRHPYDLAGASFDRGWKSCLNLTDGSNRRFLADDVRQNSLIAYLIHVDDKNINHPSARIRIFKYVNKEKPEEYLLMSDDVVYGSAPDEFAKTVKKWCTEVNSGKEEGLYCANDVYIDEGDSNLQHITSLQGALKLIDSNDFDVASVETIFHTLGNDPDRFAFLMAAMKFRLHDKWEALDQCIAQLPVDYIEKIFLDKDYRPSPGAIGVVLQLFNAKKITEVKLFKFYKEFWTGRIAKVFRKMPPSKFSVETLTVHYKFCAKLFDAADDVISSLVREPNCEELAIKFYSRSVKTQAHLVNSLSYALENGGPGSDPWITKVLATILHNAGKLSSSNKSYLTLTVPKIAEQLGATIDLQEIFKAAKLGSRTLITTLLYSPYLGDFLASLDARTTITVLGSVNWRHSSNNLLATLEPHFERMKAGPQSAALRYIKTRLTWLLASDENFDRLLSLLQKTKGVSRIHLLSSLVINANRYPSEQRRVRLLAATEGLEKALIKDLVSGKIT